MENFHIVIITPDNYQHIQCFKEVIILLKKSIEDCGMQCTFANKIFKKNAYNIIIGAHFLHPDSIPNDVKIITFQFEQLGATNGIFNSNFESVLRKSNNVWDYSLQNIDFLKKHGIDAQYVCLGFNPILKQISRDQPKDIDLLFYGSINERRRDALIQIHKDTSIKTLTLFNSYGADRDHHIARAKIVLNIHYFETQIYEAVRISYLLNNSIPVIIERSDISPYEDLNIPTCSINEFSETIMNALANYEDFKNTTEDNCRLFQKNYSMPEILNKVIKDL